MVKGVLLTTPEVLKLLHINKNTLTRLIKNGEIGYIKIGRRYLYPLEEVKAFLKRRAKNLHADIDLTDQIVAMKTELRPIYREMPKKIVK